MSGYYFSAEVEVAILFLLIGVLTGCAIKAVEFLRLRWLLYRCSKGDHREYITYKRHCTEYWCACGAKTKTTVPDY